MFSTKKKAPSIKIPSGVLKREAQKVAKKMIATERKKEKRKELRERAKEKAKKQIKQKKVQKEISEDFLDNNFQREIIAALWICSGVILLTLFFSEAPLALWVSHKIFLAGFGIMSWVIPFFMILLGIGLFMKKNTTFPPVRILGFLMFFTALCGLINLFIPQQESLSSAHEYGGALGFSIDFFPREFLGDLFTGVFLIALLWITGIIAFGLRLHHLKNIFTNKEEASEEIIAVIENSKAKEKIKLTKREEIKKEPRFKNEVEIIDSTKSQEVSKKKEVTPTKVNLEEKKKDEMTEAKNKSFHTWEPPHLDLLQNNPSTITVDEKQLREQAESIREKLDQFGIEVTMRSVHVGPTVTQFTLEPSPGVKLNKITALKSDLALALAASSVRIEAPIRGKKLVGIEIPNIKRAIVGMREILQSDVWEDAESPLTLAVGRDVTGKPIVVDLAKMPHLLIAGKTGSGKSVAMNAFLLSLLWRNSPDDLRMILIDPKRVELAPYNHIPHLLTPVIVEPEKSVSALAWAVAEMNRRYKDFSKKRCRNIIEHNEKFPEEKEPYIVIVVDELADLMMVAGKDVEAAICRIAQMARAVGMHLIIATQRPSVDVVTGLIKANLPARIAFRVSSGIDSRVVIDGVGAEELLGMGDMLYMDGNSGELSRTQGLYVTTEEVEKITNHIKLQYPEQIGSDEINEEITNQSIEGMAKGGVLTAGTQVEDENLDAKFNEAVELVTQSGKASASLLQRRLEVGYARAARILDQMEGRGIVGPARGAKPREIYAKGE